MLAGGAVALGESRHANAERHRAAGITAPIWLLRAPAPELAADTVRLFDLSLASELETCAALDAAAAAQGRRHQVLVMVDLGDLREGILPADLPAFVDAVEALEHVDLAGIGVNLTCYGAIMPDERNMSELVELARATEQRVGRRLVVGGGNSGSIGMIASGRMPAGVTDAARRRDDPARRRHAHARADPRPAHRRLRARGAGHRVQGQAEHAARHGRPGRLRQPADLRRPRRPPARDLALGRQDVMPEYLTPLDAGVEILGASSDHLILDVEEMAAPPRLGDVFRFRPNYAATVQLFTSPYVHKVFTPPA